MQTNLTPDTELLQNESSYIDRLFHIAQYKDDPNLWRKIELRRHGELVLEFRVRPLDEDEIFEMKRASTRYIPDPNGQYLPKLECETNFVRLRSLKIYNATIPEDRRRIWDNKQLQKQLSIMDGPDMVDALLMAGEKFAVLEQVDACTGYGTHSELEELAKN